MGNHDLLKLFETTDFGFGQVQMPALQRRWTRLMTTALTAGMLLPSVIRLATKRLPAKKRRAVEN